jgi:hypothetical protein
LSIGGENAGEEVVEVFVGIECGWDVGFSFLEDVA